MVEEHKVSSRQAARAVGMPHSTLGYAPKPPPEAEADAPIIEALRALVEKHPAAGFWQCFHRLRDAGHPWNHKRVYRVYKKLKMNIRRRASKRLPDRPKQPLGEPEAPNDTWSLDFLEDSLWDGRKFRLLAVIDDFNRQILAVEVDSLLPSARVVRALEWIRAERGAPRLLRLDNGPELTGRRLGDWCGQNGVELGFIQPGKPMQNAYTERCNGPVRRELLDPWVFGSLEGVRQKAQEWMHDYNTARHHSALNYQTPLKKRNAFLFD